MDASALKIIVPARTGRRRNTQNRVDRSLAPKVNVALLLTFFLLTSALANPCVTQLAEMPPVRPAYVDEADALNIILGKDHRVYYYFGLNQPNNRALPGAVLKTSYLRAPDFRRMLLDRQRRDPVAVHIKAGPGSLYPDLAAIAYEMRCTNQRQYDFASITADDFTLLKINSL